MQAEYKCSLPALCDSEADPLAADRLREAQAKLGFVPNMYGVMANSPGLFDIKRGLPDKAEVEAFLGAGYSERQILEIVLAIAVKTLSNYANHLFHTPVDAMFAGRAWAD